MDYLTVGSLVVVVYRLQIVAAYESACGAFVTLYLTYFLLMQLTLDFLSIVTLRACDLLMHRSSSCIGIVKLYQYPILRATLNDQRPS